MHFVIEATQWANIVIYIYIIYIYIIFLNINPSESDSEMFLFDPYKKCIQSDNDTMLDKGTPIYTSLAGKHKLPPIT